MSVEFEDYSRKPFHVKVVQITPMNMEELAEICGGTIHEFEAKEGEIYRKFIQVPVRRPLNKRQSEGHVGDWLTKQGSTYKVYQDKQFRQQFNRRDMDKVWMSEKKSETATTRPSPANMPRKRAEVSETSDERKPLNLENAKIRSASLQSEGGPEDGVHPIHLVEKTPPVKPMTLDEVNALPDDNPNPDSGYIHET